MRGGACRHGVLRSVGLTAIAVLLISMQKFTSSPLAASPAPVPWPANAYLIPLHPKTLPAFDDRSCVPVTEPWFGNQVASLDISIELGSQHYPDQSFQLPHMRWKDGSALTAAQLAKLFALSRFPCTKAGEHERWFQFTFGWQRGMRFPLDSPLGRAVADLVHVD